MKPIRTWILIANGTRARLVLNDGPGHGIKALKGLAFGTEAVSAKDLTGDRQGRVSDSAGPGRHALESKHHPEDLHRQQFLREVVDAIAAKYNAGEFDRLIVVASPKVMGELRAFIPDEIQQTITAEVAKDLTHLENDELIKHLSDVVAL